MSDSVKAVIINVDRKNRSINLSIKALEKADEAAAMQKLAAENTGTAGTTNLGALLRAKDLRWAISEDRVRAAEAVTLV